LLTFQFVADRRGKVRIGLLQTIAEKRRVGRRKAR
jgi:hypothetical protein